MKNLIVKIATMSKTECMIRICQLAPKELNGTISAMELLELSMIQDMREAKSEIDEVIADWEKYPDTDPRKLK